MQAIPQKSYKLSNTTSSKSAGNLTWEERSLAASAPQAVFERRERSSMRVASAMGLRELSGPLDGPAYHDDGPQDLDSSQFSTSNEGLNECGHPALSFSLRLINFLPRIFRPRVPRCFIVGAAP